MRYKPRHGTLDCRLRRKRRKSVACRTTHTPWIRPLKLNWRLSHLDSTRSNMVIQFPAQIQRNVLQGIALESVILRPTVWYPFLSLGIFESSRLWRQRQLLPG
jgi:hypothetical protein